MDKAASIFLRPDIYPEDVREMARWLQNQNVTRYLNEDADMADHLYHLLSDTPAELLTYRFNQNGRFFLACRSPEDAVGFVKMKQLSPGQYELVFAIGEDRLWGNGYGTQAVCAAQSQAFLEWRCRKLTAKIYHGNRRSVNTVQRCGFTLERQSEKLDCYSISMQEYLELLQFGQERQHRIS